MRLSILLVAAASAITALAQTSQIAFTSVPAVVVAGKTYNITWAGGDGTSPITITLRKGDPAALQTISTLTSGATGYSYTWDVSTSLATASDYALQIAQGQSDVNYSGLFSLVGGAGSSSITNTATLTSNATATRSTDITSLRTATSLGTSTAMPRNATFSSATPSLSGLPSTSLVASVTTTSSSRAASSVVQSTTTPTGAASQLVGSGSLLLSVFVGFLIHAWII